MLGERQEFQSLANDQTFSEMRARKDSVSQLLQYAPLQSIAKSPELLLEIWEIAKPDLKDLTNFLWTAQSPKYSEEPILGRWLFSSSGTAAALRQANPNYTALQMARARRHMQGIYARTLLVVGTKGRMVVKEWPDLTVVPAKDQPQPLGSGKGEWDGAGGFYKLKFTVGSTELAATAKIEGERMTLKMGNAAVAFEPEY